MRGAGSRPCASALRGGRGMFGGLIGRIAGARLFLMRKLNRARMRFRLGAQRCVKKALRNGYGAPVRGLARPPCVGTGNVWRIDWAHCRRAAFSDAEA